MRKCIQLKLNYYLYFRLANVYLAQTFTKTLHPSIYFKSFYIQAIHSFIQGEEIKVRFLP